MLEFCVEKSFWLEYFVEGVDRGEGESDYLLHFLLSREPRPPSQDPSLRGF